MRLVLQGCWLPVLPLATTTAVAAHAQGFLLALAIVLKMMHRFLLQAHGPDLLLGLSPNTLVVDVSAVQAHAANAVRRLLRLQQQVDGKASEAAVEQQQQQQERHQQHGEQQSAICSIYFTAPGDTLVAARGGMGGRGNLAFVSNQ